jgi:FkbM family methyltransferase
MSTVQKLAKQVIPKRVRQRMRSVTRWPVTARIVSDAGSFRRFRRAENSTLAWPAGTLLPISVRALEGRSVLIRPGTADSLALIGTFAGVHHLPPDGLSPVRTIWDLGANVGLTAAHLADRHRAARIIGVELDDENAALARRNLGPWADRCEVRRAAVWPSDGSIEYRRDVGAEQGHRVAPLADVAPNASAPALSLDTLLRESGSPTIDYVKMDIEGAEGSVLRENTAWAAAVRSIKVEVHPPYTTEECRADLEALGFRCVVDTRHWALVTGIRPES